MRSFNIETPSGLHIRVEGSSIYYRMICDFHVTKMRKFMERLEEVLVNPLSRALFETEIPAGGTLTVENVVRGERGWELEVHG